MLKIENTEVFGWEAAIRGMRNPMNSWDQSDSNFDCTDCTNCIWENNSHTKSSEDENWIYTDTWCNHSPCTLGENDMKLMKNLAKAGSDHAKYLRMINVTMDVTAPLYWWKEFDTYKVGTVANSCSTMHKIHSKEFTLDDFSHEHVVDMGEHALIAVVQALNCYRDWFLKTKDKEYWWQMIQLLPSSYNQRRTVQLNYEVLRTQRRARKNHKLDCWHTYCDWIDTLPYAKELIIGEE